MGNKLNPIPESLTKEYEHIAGKKLIRAVKSNLPAQLEESYELAKSELLPKSKSTAHDKEYETMVTKMITYLTRGYNIGDGILFTKTPLEIAEEYHADQSIRWINTKLEYLQKNEVGRKLLEDKEIKVKSTSAVGPVDRERVHSAKERLKQFQKEYEENKKK